jgi:amidase
MGPAAHARAAGLTPLEVGSDLAGSIRLPAHFCGVFGHKPSFGLVSMRGHVPGPPGTLSRSDISVAGPLARSADDLALALDLLAGPDPEDEPAWRLELPPPRHAALADYRIAAWLDDPACPIDKDMLEVLQGAVERIRAAGVRVDERARPDGVDLAQSDRVFYALMTATLGAGLPPKVFDKAIQTAAAGEAADTDYNARFAHGASTRHADWLRLNEKRQRLRKAWAEFFRDYDVLLCPVAHTPAFPHDQSNPVANRRLTINGEPRPYMQVVTWVGLAGVVYLPSTVVPVGRTKAGLPVGVQVVGPYLEDRTTIEFARHLERLTGGFVAPPGY